MATSIINQEVYQAFKTISQFSKLIKEVLYTSLKAAYNRYRTCSGYPDGHQDKEMCIKEYKDLEVQIIKLANLLENV